MKKTIHPDGRVEIEGTTEEVAAYERAQMPFPAQIIPIPAPTVPFVPPYNPFHSYPLWPPYEPYVWCGA